MKKTILLIALTVQIQSIYSQEKTQDSIPSSAWTKGGTFSFLVNQSSFDNWVAGGVSNISGAVGINYDLILVLQKLKNRTYKNLMTA